MANWTILKEAIANVIKTNGNQEITGQVLQNTLNNIISSVGENTTFVGIATSATNPGVPDGPVFYFATKAGIYSNFGGLEVLDGEAVIFEWDNGAWSKKVTGFATQEKLTEIETSKFVQYNEAQSLTDSQKKQARLNINAPKLTDITLEGLDNFIIKNDSEEGVSHILACGQFLKKLDQYCVIKVLMYDKSMAKESVTFGNTFTSSMALVQISGGDGTLYFRLTPTTQAPYNTSTLPDVFTEYNMESHAFKITAKINWHQLYSVSSYNFGNNFGILLRNVTYVSQSAIYPFVGGGNLNLRALSYIKDIYIPNRDPQLHYFIWYSYPSITDYYQICLASSPVDGPESSDDITQLVAFEMRRSNVTSEMRKGYYLWEKNGYKILIDFNEADNTPINLDKYLSRANASNVNFDWHNIDTNSPILLADKIAAKQDKLVSGTNIKTINNQSLLGEGNIDALPTNYNSLINKPSVNGIELLGNKSLDDLNIQEKLVSGLSVKTINSQSILGKGNIQIAESIVNLPDNVTLEESNSILRLKELNNSSYKYGFKHVYDDITITTASISSWASSIVEIKGTITLTGSSNIDLPNNCILYFNGGSMRGVDFTGKLYPHSAKIIASPYQIFFGNFKIYEAYGNDKFFADIAYGEWFGAKGDGISPDGWAFDKLTSSIYCNKIQLLKKTYILERSISIGSCTLSGYGAKLKRYAKFADVLITAPTVASSSGTHTLSVDTNSPTYTNLEVGMAVFIMDKVSTNSSRRVAGGRWVISDINGSAVTIVGNSMDVVYLANTMCLVTGYNLVNLNGKNAKVEGITLDGLFDLTNPIYPLDRTPWEADCTIGGGYNVENAIIENCYIINSLADAIMVGGKNNIFSHNTILHSGANGIHLSGNYVVHIDNNYIFDSNLNPLTFHNEGAITYSNNVFEVTITNNVFDNCLAGIGSIDSADGCKSIIMGNIFRNFRTHGIQGNATNTSYGNITKQFIISNNRFIGTQDDAASWETSYLYTPLIPRQEATGYGIYLYGSSSSFWNSIMINDNDFEDCGLYVGNALLLMFNNNIINFEHTFTSSTPTNIIQILNTTGSAQGNVILSNSPSKTNCFVLNGSKVAVNRNSYKLTNCTLSDTSYALMADNVNIS